MDPEMEIETLVRRLGLAPHPEGGYFRETYRSAGTIPAAALDPAFSGDRSYGTAIYFLLTAGSFSAFHRIRQDEVWHFYRGAPLTIHAIDPAGALTTFRLGGAETDLPPQAVVPAGCWFASCVEEGAYALAGCTVAPGFSFDDFELGDRGALARAFPHHADLVRRLTR